MNEFSCSRPAEILLAEDNENDVELTRIGFQKSKLPVNLHRAKDGEECMAFLHKDGQYADAPTPDILLLDLNMPRMNGHEVMAAMLADEALRSIPVVVLTTSTNGKEILKMYKMRCSSYIVKPVDINQFWETVQTLARYWFGPVTLPKSDAN